jgi:hypothetical protein
VSLVSSTGSWISQAEGRGGGVLRFWTLSSQQSAPQERMRPGDHGPSRPDSLGSRWESLPP